MATESLGVLLVKLVFDDSEFTRGADRATSKFNQIGSQLTGSALKVNAAITGAFAAAGASVAGLAAGAAQVGSAFERQISIVGAIGGSTGDELAGLAQEARRLGRETEFTAQQTAEALTVLAQAGKNARESVELLPSTLAFAQAQSADLASATELLVSTTNTFAQQQVSAAQASDVFTRATQTSQLNFSRLTESLKFAGPQAAAFNISLEETTAVLGAFADRGIQGSLAGTVFRGALAATTTQSKEQKEILDALGLSFDQISPRFLDASGNAQGLVGVLDTLSKAGITAEDTIRLFGTRAGPALAQLLADGDSAIQGIRDQIGVLGESAGATEEQVKQVTDNVQGAYAQVISRLQDVGITGFETFRGPLKQALQSLVPFLQTIGDAVANVSDRITNTLQVAADRLNKVLERDGADAAETFANALVLAADTLSALVNILDKVASAIGLVKRTLDALGLTELLDDLAVVVGTVSTLITGLTALGAVLGGTTSATAAFGTAVSALGGPLGLLVVAIGAAVAAWIQYRVAVAEAREETEALSNVARQLKNLDLGTLSSVGGGRDPAEIGETTAALAKQRLETENLTGALRDEAEALAALGDATPDEIRSKVLSGELVVVGDQLRTISGIVTDMDPEGFEALESTARKFTSETKAIERNLEGVKRRFEEAQQVAREGGPAVFEFGTENATREFIAQQEARAKALGAAADNLAKQRIAAERRVLAEETKAEEERTAAAEREAQKRVAISEKEADDRKKIADAAVEEILRAGQAARDEAATLLLSDQDQVRRNFRMQEQELLASLRVFLDNFAGTEEERKAIVAATSETIVRLRKNAQIKIAQIDADQAEEAAKAAQKTAEEFRKAYEDLEEGLRDLEDYWMDTFDDLIEGPGFFQRKFQEAADNMLAKARDAFPKLTLLASDTAKAIGAAFSGVAGVFDMLTGGALSALNPAQIVGDIQGQQGDAADALGEATTAYQEAQDALAKAREEQGRGGDFTELVAAVQEARANLTAAEEEAAMTVRERTKEAVRGAVDQAVAFVTTLAQAIGPLIRELARQLPTVVDAIVKALPKITQALIASIPKLIEALITQFPKLVLAMVKALFQGLGQIGKFFGQAFINGFKAVGKAIAEFFSGIFKKALNPFKKLGDLFKKNDQGDGFFKKIGNSIGSLFGAQGGISMMAGPAVGLMHTGEAMLTAQQNRERLFGPPESVARHSPAAPDPFLAAPSSAAMSPRIALEVRLDGQRVDQFNVDADKAGKRGRTNKANRQKTGIRTGYTRPTQTR